MEWRDVSVLVTGGASLIGSHLVDALVARHARVRVVDDLSSGCLENLVGHLKAEKIEWIQADLSCQVEVEAAVRDQEVVFHLAADHGGRGYVDLNQAACARNLMLDGLVFDACRRAGVAKVVYASSGCVYPNHLQTSPQDMIYLVEDRVGPPYDADNLYGWAKLMGEKTLRAYYETYGMKSVSCRYFTVYGPRGVENHAIIAMIARAFIGQDPFEIWGTGEQIRNWTYVSDIVAGTLLAAEHIDNGMAVNLGTMERTTVMEAAREVLRYTGVKATLKTRPDMPTGPYNRVADNTLAKRLLGWEPQVAFIDGLHRTIDWYFSSKNPAEVKEGFERRLIER